MTPGLAFHPVIRSVASQIVAQHRHDRSIRDVCRPLLGPARMEDAAWACIGGGDSEAFPAAEEWLVGEGLLEPTASSDESSSDEDSAPSPSPTPGAPQEGQGGGNAHRPDVLAGQGAPASPAWLVSAREFAAGLPWIIRAPMIRYPLLFWIMFGNFQVSLLCSVLHFILFGWGWAATICLLFGFLFASAIYAMLFGLFFAGNALALALGV